MKIVATNNFLKIFILIIVFSCKLKNDDSSSNFKNLNEKSHIESIVKIDSFYNQEVKFYLLKNYDNVYSYSLNMESLNVIIPYFNKVGNDYISPNDIKIHNFSNSIEIIFYQGNSSSVIYLFTHLLKKELILKKIIFKVNDNIFSELNINKKTDSIFISDLERIDTYLK
jgi:hypothetical protein